VLEASKDQPGRGASLAQSAAAKDVGESDDPGEFDGDEPEDLLTKVRLSKRSAPRQLGNKLPGNEAPMQGAGATVLRRTDQVRCQFTNLSGLH